MTAPPAGRPAAPREREVDARAVAAAVERLPDVRLDGTAGVGTFLRGDWVPGVRIRSDRVEVHVTVLWPRPVLAAADAVRSAVAPLAPGRVDVVVADVHEEAGPAPAPLSAPSAPRAPSAAPGRARTVPAPLPVEGTP